MYTNGYDCFCPPEPVCFHLWSRNHIKPSNLSTHTKIRSEQERQSSRRNAQRRVRRLLGINRLRDDGTDVDENIDMDIKSAVGVRYGLGSIRSIKEFEVATGIQFSTMEINNSLAVGSNLLDDVDLGGRTFGDDLLTNAPRLIQEGEPAMMSLRNANIVSRIKNFLS